MSQQPRFLYMPLAGTILLCLLVGIYLFAKKRAGKSRPAKAVKHPIKTPAKDVLSYWTAEKMRNAKPMPMPTVNKPEGEQRHPDNSDS